MPIVRLDKVSLSFGLKPLLDNVDLQIRKGERVCLLGRNGEGKSSLLQLITRQLASRQRRSVGASGRAGRKPGPGGVPASDASVHDVVHERLRPAAHDAIGRPNCRPIR